MEKRERVGGGRERGKCNVKEEKTEDIFGQEKEKSNSGEDADILLSW